MQRISIYSRRYKTKIIHRFEILNASEDDTATYRLSLHNMESNKIRTIVDGMCEQFILSEYCQWPFQKLDEINFPKHNLYKITCT